MGAAFVAVVLTPEEIRAVGSAHEAMHTAVRSGLLADWRLGRLVASPLNFSYYRISDAHGGAENLLLCPVMARHGWTALIRAHEHHLAERVAAQPGRYVAAT